MEEEEEEEEEIPRQTHNKNDKKSSYRHIPSSLSNKRKDGNYARTARGFNKELIKRLPNLPSDVEEWLTHGWRMEVKDPYNQEFRKDIEHNLSAKREPKIVDEIIRDHIAEGFLREIKREEVLTLNPLTLVRKPGKDRLCLDLSRRLNDRIETPKFRLAGIREHLRTFQKGIWMCKIDLKNGYMHININTESQRHLAFLWKGKYYAYNRMVFGINKAPYIFVRIIDALLEPLRKSGIKCIAYIDDIWIEGATPTEARRNTRLVKTYLEMIGWNINYQKSSLKPKREMEYLGWVFNSKKGTIKPNQAKINRVLTFTTEMLRDWPRRPKVKRLRKIIGTLAHVASNIVFARTHLRALYKWLHKGEREQRLIGEINWWKENIDKLETIAIDAIDPRLKIQEIWTTDASEIGAGFTNGHIQWRIDWNREKEHTNERELRAILELLKVSKENTWLHVKCDNTSAVAAVNNGGSGKKRLNKIRESLWRLQNHKNIRLTAEYYPGIDNTLSDKLSRRKGGPAGISYSGIRLHEIRQMSEFRTSNIPEDQTPQDFSKLVNTLQDSWRSAEEEREGSDQVLIETLDRAIYEANSHLKEPMQFAWIPIHLGIAKLPTTKEKLEQIINGVTDKDSSPLEQQESNDTCWHSSKKNKKRMLSARKIC